MYAARIDMQNTQTTEGGDPIIQEGNPVPQNLGNGFSQRYVRTQALFQNTVLNYSAGCTNGPFTLVNALRELYSKSFQEIEEMPY